MPDGSAMTPHPRIDVEPAQLLVGGWTWEPAVSWPVDDLSEGPLGSVDLSLRTAHEGLLPPDIGRANRHRSPGGAPLTVGDRATVQPALWKRLAYLLQPSTEVLVAEGGPVEWPGGLFPYQIDGVRTLVSRHAVLLADEMGLGKTVEAVAALRILALQRRVEAVLVVVPAGLIPQWRRAIGTWAPELRVSVIRGGAAERAWQWMTAAHVYLTSYDSLREDGLREPQAPARRRLWDVVVLDEAQRIKNRAADISRVCKALLRRRAWALTGTPLENDLDELASILEFVAPRSEQTGGVAPLYAGPKVIARQQAVQLRRRKLEVLPQLPAKLTSTVILALGSAQRAAYERAEREGIYDLRARGAAVRIENVLELITRLKQLCNVDPATGQSAKLANLSERLETLTAEGHRALVFSQYTDATFGARAIAAHLARFRPLLYTGDMSVWERERVIRAFKEDSGHAVLVLSLRAGGQGLNLQEAAYVFHFDRWWNPAVERQAEDRSHRLGQRYPVHVYAYTCERTIEERVEEVLRGKERLFREVVDEVTLDLRAILTTAELFGLVGLGARPSFT
jgi:SNF2 family DNA or RNA helicase